MSYLYRDMGGEIPFIKQMKTIRGGDIFLLDRRKVGHGFSVLYYSNPTNLPHVEVGPTPADAMGKLAQRADLAKEYGQEFYEITEALLKEFG